MASFHMNPYNIFSFLSIWPYCSELTLSQRLVSFTTELQAADSLLQKAIKKVDETKTMDTAQVCFQTYHV